MNAASAVVQSALPALHNIEGEAALLGVLLNDNARVDTIADILTAEDFAEPAHGAIYQAVLDATATGKYATPVSLRPVFDADERFALLGGGAYLAKLSGGLLGIGPLLSVRSQAEHLADLAAKRRLHKALLGIADAVEDPDLTIASIIDEGDAALVSAAQRRDAVHQVSGAGAIAEAIDRIAAIRQGSTGTGVKTGIAEFDELTGGMEAGQIILIGARPGMGKTAVMCSAALGCARGGAGTGIFSLEMQSTELGLRLVSDICCTSRNALPFDRLVAGDLSDSEVRELVRAQHQMAEWPLEIVDKGGLTISRLSMLARRMKRRMAARGTPLRVIFIDYIQLLRPDQRGQSAYEAVSEISRELKTLAKDLGVAIVALAQLNRGVESREDKRPQLSDLRDSGQLEQDADIVMFLYREQYYVEKQEPVEDDKKPVWQAKLDGCRNRLDLLMPKRRNGPSGTRWCWYFAHYQAVRGKGHQ